MAYSLPDPLISAYRHLVLHVSILDGTILNRFKQSVLRGQMSDDVLVGEDSESRSDETKIPKSIKVQNGRSKERACRCAYRQEI